MLDVRLLGPLQVVDDDRRIEIRARKQRALLAVLALDVGRSLSSARLVEDLWGEQPPRTAPHALENYVSELRKTLGKDAIETGPAGYALALSSDQVDAVRFERLAAAAREGGAEERAAELRATLSLVRGPPLADLAFEPFAGPAIGRLEELELAAREDLAEAELELGRHATIIGELEAVVSAHRYRERPRAQLMLALYRSGRQADALAVYREARRVLVDDLGIDPGEELQQLERAILRQDESLRTPPRAPGAAVGSAPSSVRVRPTRKTVTLVHAELANAPALAEALDPEPLRVVLDRYRAAARTATERHEGVSVRLAGEASLAVFGVPATHEDDGLRAIRSAHELRDAIGVLNDGLLPEHGVYLEVRTAVTTGEVLVTPDEGELVTGRPVAAAETLQRAARPGQILLDQATQRLVRDSVGAEPLEVAGLVGYRLVELLPDVHGRLLRLDSPLVGRRRQLAALANAFESAVADHALHAFVLLGAPGVGKSRLVREFVAGVAGVAKVLEGRCLPYGESMAFWPLHEAFREARLPEVEVGELSEASVQVALERLALEQPLVVVLDDLQWADPTLLDTLEAIADSARAPATLLVLVARHELVESRPHWAHGNPKGSSLLLEPLSETESDRLIDNLLGESDVPDAIRDYILRIADGNPLFVEELLATLVERDILTREAGRWTTTQMEAVPLPATIQALIGARLDRLPAPERLVVDLASVEGKRTFGRDVVAELAGDDDVDASACLAALVRRELVRPQPDEDRFAFRHQVIRDVAYASIPMQRRGELHDRMAAIAEARGERETDVESVVMYHRDQAERYRAELGSLGDGHSA